MIGPFGFVELRLTALLRNLFLCRHERKLAQGNAPAGACPGAHRWAARTDRPLCLL